VIVSRGVLQGLRPAPSRLPPLILNAHLGRLVCPLRVEVNGEEGSDKGLSGNLDVHEGCRIGVEAEGEAVVGEEGVDHLGKSDCEVAVVGAEDSGDRGVNDGVVKRCRVVHVFILHPF